MEAVFVKIGDTLVGLGLPGIFILVLLIGLVAAVKGLISLFKYIIKLHEARAEEIRVVVKAIDDSTATYKDVANILRQRIGN